MLREGPSGSVLHSPQPADESSSVQHQTTRSWWGKRIRKYLRQHLTLEIQVRAGVSHRGVEAGVAEPLADGGEVDARLEQRDGRAVADRVRVQVLVPQGWRHSCRLG